MLERVDEIAADILARKIDKRAAVEGFESLSAADRGRLISRLKSAMPAGGCAQTVAPRRAGQLRCINERQLGASHLRFISDLADRYARFAPTSKQNAVKHRRYLVDARKIANLKKPIKSLQFHITYKTAVGPYLHDVDGNRYIDITGDNGVNLFGGSPELIANAVTNRVKDGYPLVGYTEELFEAAKLFCELTGNERVAFTQSGTEAVMWAVRMARAATRRSKIVIFERSYHGLSDTVGAVRSHDGSSVSAGLGIPQEYADQLIVLEYGNAEHLEIIAERSEEIAGVLVEPVQAAQPHLQPGHFLQELRKLTLETGMLLIFDEMITGFRVCPRGAQGHFGVKADIATYGKIAGGGMPTGMIGGAAKYLDFIDGGQWELEGSSMPKLERIYLGGTHTRNPVKLAATVAVLREMKRLCPGTLDCRGCSCFQKQLSARTEAMAEELNSFFREQGLPVRIDYFSSLFKFTFIDDPFGIVREMFLVQLRMNGVETSVSGNFFLTTAHSDEDVKAIVTAVKSSLSTLLTANFFLPVEDGAPQATEDSGGTAPGAQRGVSDADRQLEKLKELIRADFRKFEEGAH